MNRQELQSILQQPYQRDRWLELFRSVLPGTEVFASPQSVPAAQSHIDSIVQLGRARLQGERQLAVLEAVVAGGIDLARNRVGLRNLVARMIDQAEYHGVLVLFHSSDSKDYRFTFAARESVFDLEGNLSKRETAPRRYTYLLGPNETCRTAAERFAQLGAKAHGAELKDVVDAFSVEKLNKEFFADFCRAFEKVRDDIAKWHSWDEETVKSEAQTLLNRLLFLYFVQRKGWLNRQRDYLIRNFQSCQSDDPAAATFHKRFLRPLFERLSTEDTASLLADQDLPFLNGGLFNDEFGSKSHDQLSRRRRELTISNSTYSYIFDHLLEPYNFTIHEDSPNDYEVAIDPEMLGRIFEALVLQGEESDAGGKSIRHDTGSHYTPRPIVHYLCRNALAAWLENQLPFSGGKNSRKRIDQLLAMDATEGIDDESRQRLNGCLDPEDAAILRNRLFELRSCDPAVGSGAFPMGLLHELINLMRLCETRARGKDPVDGDDSWLYDTKKRIIERVIYGVDNQERAVEICKLRLWLSLMVDHDLEVDPENCEASAFRKALKSLNPLPNLDFKIRRANSLIDYVRGEPINLDSPDPGKRTRPILDKLIAAKQEFYAARTARDKRKLRFLIYEATAELAQVEFTWARTSMGLIVDNSNASRAIELDWAQRETSSILAQIKNAKTARVDQQERALAQIHSWFEDSEKPTFVWQLDFAEVFHPHSNGTGPSARRLLKDTEEISTGKSIRFGFDIIIGNPPYVRIQTLAKTDPEAVAYYKENFEAAKKGNYDLYVVFVERGLALLDGRNGQLGYILPHKFFNLKYGEPLRALISKGKYLRHVVHFGNQQIFPGATNYVCLLFLSNVGVEEGCRFVQVSDLNQWLSTTQAPEGIIPTSKILKTEWNFSVVRGSDLLERLQAMPVKLGDIVEKIYQGLATSADSIYVLSLLSNSKRTCQVWSHALEQELTIENDLIHPLLKGSEIHRYAEPLSKSVVLFPYHVIDGGAIPIPLSELEKEFPLTLDYLLKNKPKLLSRSKCDESNWWLFPYPKNLAMYVQPKIVIQVLSTRGTAFLDRKGSYYFVGGGTAGGNAIKTHQNDLGELRFLTGVLNSFIATYYVSRIASAFRGGFYAFGKSSLHGLPIPVDPSGAPRNEQVEGLVELLIWLHNQPSVSGSDPKRPQDPAMASFFDQVLNALLYELFFEKELHALDLYVFNLVNESSLPKFDSLPFQASSRLQDLFDLFQKLQSPGHPIRKALDKLQSLDLVRIIEGGA